MKGIALMLAALAVTGCTQPSAEVAERKPRQAGQPLNPLSTAGRIAAIDAAAITGDQQAVRQQMDGFSDDFRRSLKMGDPARRIDREAARVAAKAVEGVRSVVWVDRDNLLAIVERNEQRSQRMIDAICLQLAPLGDTLGVVVNLQSGAARNGDDLEVLSRDCQLASGDRAFAQTRRRLDVIPPEIRAQQKASNAGRPSRRSGGSDEAMRLLKDTTPEM